MIAAARGLRQTPHRRSFGRRPWPQRSVWCLVAGALVAILSSALWTGTVAGAVAMDGGPTISELRVQVMPEFDDPRVLVIVQGRLNMPETDLPVEMTLPVPRGAQINQMAVMNTSSGTIESQPFSAVADPDKVQWTLVTYELSSAHFFYEYYYAPFALSEPQRQFTFDFVTPYAIDELKIEVQQPLKATGFSLVPPATLAQYDETLGFTYHLYEAGPLAAGEGISTEVSYVKDAPEPSITRAQLQSAQGGGATSTNKAAAPSSAQELQGLWVGLSVLGAGAAAWAWTKRDSIPRGPARRRLTTTRPAAPKREAASGQNGRPTDHSTTSYCAKCGARLRREAHFCHVCGSRADA